MIGGLAATIAWVGCQAIALQVSNADTAFVSRFSFFARIGAMSAPIAIGAAWDALGPWPAFLITGLWGAVFLAATLLVPASEGEKALLASPTQPGKARTRFRFG